MSKQAQVKAPVIVTIPGLKPQARAIASAYKKAESAQAAIGAAIIKAADGLKADQIEPFVGMVKTELAGVIAPASLKVEASRIRRVLASLVAGDIKPAGTETLRQMYESCPKDAAKGGRKTGARTVETETHAAQAPVAQDKDAARKAAITTLFGTCNPELLAAVDYAASHSGIFMSWASASIKAAQIAEMEKLAAQAPTKPAKAAAPKKTGKVRKAA